MSHSRELQMTDVGMSAKEFVKDERYDRFRDVASQYLGGTTKVAAG